MRSNQFGRHEEEKEDKIEKIVMKIKQMKEWEGEEWTVTKSKFPTKHSWGGQEC